MLPGLLQVGTVAGTIERHLSLFAAALRANTPVHGGTEALFLADFTDRTAQEGLSLPIMASRRLERRWPKRVLRSPRDLLGRAISEPVCCGAGMISAVLGTPARKNRIKCGQNATFPQDSWCKIAALATKQAVPLRRIHGFRFNEDPAGAPSGGEARDQQQNGSVVSRASRRHRHQRDEEEWRVRRSRPRPFGESASQGSRRTEPADRRADSDQSQDRREVSRRQGCEGRDRSQEVVRCSGKKRRPAAKPAFCLASTSDSEYKYQQYWGHGWLIFALPSCGMT